MSSPSIYQSQASITCSNVRFGLRCPSFLPLFQTLAARQCVLRHARSRFPLLFTGCSWTRHFRSMRVDIYAPKLSTTMDSEGGTSTKQADFGPFDDANNYYGEQDCADAFDDEGLSAWYFDQA